MSFLSNLIKRKAVTNSKKSVDSLVQAVKNLDEQKVRKMLSKGAEVNISIDHNSRNNVDIERVKRPLIHLAFDQADKEQMALEIIKILIENGANINARDEFNNNWTLLTHAVFKKYLNIIQFLSENGADDSLQDVNGKTAFQLVLSMNDSRYNKVMLLLTKLTKDGLKWAKTEPGQKWIDNLNNISSTPIPVSVVEITDELRRAFKGFNAKMLKKVIKWVESGGDLDWQSPNGWTLLHLAAQSGNEEMVRFLIKSGSDIEAKDEEGHTPLIISCDARWIALEANSSVVEALLENGANPKAYNFSRSTAYDLISEKEFSARKADKVEEYKDVFRKYGGNKG